MKTNSLKNAQFAKVHLMSQLKLFVVISFALAVQWSITQAQAPVLYVMNKRMEPLIQLIN